MMLRKLLAYQSIPPHIDVCGHRMHAGRRFHVPLVTHPGVTMRWPLEDVEVHLEAGYLYEVRFDVLHEVINLAPVDRVHAVVNVLAPTLAPSRAGRFDAEVRRGGAQK